MSGGSPYSYCGVHEHDVCCLVPENAEPVGILPSQGRTRCGKKGKDTGKEGEAEMAEWPWHVSWLASSTLNIGNTKIYSKIHLKMSLGSIFGQIWPTLAPYAQIFERFSGEEVEYLQMGDFHLHLRLN